MEVEKLVHDLKLEDVLPNRFQPRIKFSEDSINELANSIKEHGVIQPIVVRRIGDKFEIIAGERRYKASQIAGKDTIPAIISDLDDSDSAEIALLENVQRENLTPIEEAISYKKILDMGYTQEQLAQKIGNKQSTIANKVRLLNLTDEVQEALLENKISERHARSLLKISSSKLQVKMLEKIIEGRYTVRKTDEEIDKLLKGELDMNENNEILTTVPTSKIYEEEVPVVVTVPKVEQEPVIEQVKPEVQIAPVPVEVEEKVETIIPTQIAPQVKEQPFDTKFLEKETFVNMPMHSIPETQPLGETSGYSDGKYFELEKQKIEEQKVDTTFNDIFGSNSQSHTPSEEKLYEDSVIMPTFDFSTISPLDNIETVSFGEEISMATPSFVSPLTELPSMDDISAITENIPTLEEMSNSLNANENKDTNISVMEAPVLNDVELSSVQSLEPIAPIMPVVEAPSLTEVVLPEVTAAPIVEPVAVQVEEPIVPVAPVMPVVETPVAEVVLPEVAAAPIVEPVAVQVEEPIVPVAPVMPVVETPVAEVVLPEVTAAPIVEPVVDAVALVTGITQNEVETPLIHEYSIPTFDPIEGSSVEVVNEDIRPAAESVVAPVMSTVDVISEQPSVEIKLPFDLETINSLKNDFVKLLQEKGFNVSTEDMDLSDNYKIIFTIEK